MKSGEYYSVVTTPVPWKSYCSLFKVFNIISETKEAMQTLLILIDSLACGLDHCSTDSKSDDRRLKF